MRGPRFGIFTLFALLPLSCLGSVLGAHASSSTKEASAESNGAIVTKSTNIILEPKDSITITVPPSFAVAHYGFRHHLNAIYSPRFGPSSPDDCVYESGAEVPGMTIGNDGIVEFLPQLWQTDSSYTVSVVVTARRNGSDLYSETFSFTTRVIPAVPKLVVSEANAGGFGFFGGARTRFTYGLDISLNTSDKRFVRYSLINPPAGVFLNEYSKIVYPTAEFGEGSVEVPIHVRYEMDTLAGVVSDEIEFVQELLPTPPRSGTLENWNRMGSGPGAVLGFSMASHGRWLIAGEPYLGDSSLSAPTGSAYLFRVEPSGTVNTHKTLTPAVGKPGEQFGGSVAVRDAEGDLPPVAVVGAPIARGGPGGNFPRVGRIDVFERDDAGTWLQVASLAPPAPVANLYAGGWVDVSRDVLVASVEGAASAGPFTGAVAIYRRSQATPSWEWAQTLTAPDAGAHDYFGYPLSVQGNWIAAAANEDDEAGMNAGAVHLFEMVDGLYIHRQKLLSPEPQPWALFGERLKLFEDWLFVSALRQDSNRGAVYVFRLIGGSWLFQHRLDAPFVTDNSGFGAALSAHEDTLCVTASGSVLGAVDYPRSRLTLYRLIEGRWEWANQLVGDNFERESGLGISVAQVTRYHTITGIPFQNLNQGRTLGGRIVRFEWPVLTPQTFESALAQLSPGITPCGDEDRNGVTNVIQWAMGQNPVLASHTWRHQTAFSRPSVEVSGDRLRLIIPPIVRGWTLDLDILISTDGRSWIKAEKAQWEKLEYFQFGSYIGLMQPITVPLPYNPDQLFMRLHIR